MNMLCHGPLFCTLPGIHQAYRDAGGANLRVAGTDPGADYVLGPRETAAELVARVRRDWEPDLFVCWCPEIAPPPLAIEECPIPTAAIVSDWNVYYAQLRDNLSRYDIAVTDRLGTRCLLLHECRAHFVAPIYAHQSGVHRCLDLPRDIDVVFAGNLNPAAHPKRTQLLERIAAIPGGWKVHIDTLQDPEAYTRLLNRGRIAFNASLRGEMNLRCFEALACGALLFIEQENLEAHDLLQDGRDAVFYTEDNLLERLRYCLEHPRETQRMAQAGLQRGKELAGENRLNAFLEAVAALPPSGRPFRSLPPQRRALAEVMQYSVDTAPARREHVANTLASARAQWPEEEALAAALAVLQFQQCQEHKDSRGKALRDCKERFGALASRRPECIAPWLNLAFLARHAGAGQAETAFLQHAVDTTSLDLCDALLWGRRDRYTARFHHLRAQGHANIGVLHAGAAARLAELHFHGGRHEEAGKWARQSLACYPETSDPYRVLGEIGLAAGDARGAVATLEQGMVYTVADAIYRTRLVEAYHQADRAQDALALARESLQIFTNWPGAQVFAKEMERFLEMFPQAREGQ